MTRQAHLISRGFRLLPWLAGVGTLTTLPVLLAQEPAAPRPRMTATLTQGGTVAGSVLAQTATDLQLLADDGKVYLLRKSGDRYRRVTSQTQLPRQG